MEILVVPVETGSGEWMDRLVAAGVEESRVVRVDLAWEMFYGRAHTWKEGALFLRVPQASPRVTSRVMTQWMRSVFGRLYDGMARGAGLNIQPVLVLFPPCSKAAEELVVRHFSFFSESVKRVVNWDGQGDPYAAESVDAWVPPVVPAGADTELLQQFSSESEKERMHWYTPALGMENVSILKYRIEPGVVAARLHSHSDIDEFYLVLEGTCTIRFGTREQVVSAGDLVTKPKGTGLATQVYNHSDQAATILDWEFWTDMGGTDICVYPEHGEVYLRGKGLRHEIPLEAVDSAVDMGAHYETGYRRLRDGSFEPKEMLGVPVRKTEEGII